MVQGVNRLRKRLSDVPAKVRVAVIEELETQAEKIVRDMRGLIPARKGGSGAAVPIDVGWTWGAPPRGAIAIAYVGYRKPKAKDEKLKVTIYATGPNGFNATWFEFGTADRVTADGGERGRMTATPFFFPAYRANRKAARAAISRAVTRAMKNA